MSRADLRALTPDALAALANRGLVKRAQKEIEAGQVPTLEELPDGTVVGRFGDVETKLPPQIALRDAPCTCGAVGVCRHKLIVVLTYASHANSAATAGHDAAASAAKDERAVSSLATAPTPAWSPGSFTDDELERFLGKRVWERAKWLRRQGYVAEIRRAAFDNSAPTALLPTCSVRFLVPRDLSYAHTDSGERGLEAVALAVWAFREADLTRPEALRVELEISDGKPSAGLADLLSPAIGLAHELLLEGVIHSSDSLAGQFERARQTLNASRLVWPALILEDLEQELSAYHARSARYNPAHTAALVCELFARQRAVRRASEMPAPRILGTEDAPETALDHLRLAALGARVQGDASYRLAEVVLADPDTATVLVMRKEYTLTQGQPAPKPSELARKTFASRATLAAIAAGQLVTASARRGANRLLTLGQSRVARTSVVPSNGDWSSLPEGLRVCDTSKLARELAERPPNLLRPRLLADGVHVLEVAAVEGVNYAPAEQRLHAVLTPPQGPSVQLVRTHDPATPGALGDLATALSGKTGPVRFVSGSVRATSRGLQLSPIGVVTDRFHVPDLADPSDGALPTTAQSEPEESHLKHTLDEAMRALDDAAHHGLRRASRGYAERLAQQGYALRRVGLTHLAARFDALGAALQVSGASGEVDAETALVARWADAAIRLHLCQEQL